MARLLLAISRHPDGHAGTSALPPKADIQMHQIGQGSKSGHSMSALPPEADIREGIAGCLLMTQSGHWGGRALTEESTNLEGFKGCYMANVEAVP